jgi:Na+/proline symporter
MQTGFMIGYGIIAVFGLLFYFISSQAAKRFYVDSVEDFTVAGRSLPFGYLAASILVAWTWTTTIMGAAEAGMWYGISGGLAYSFGAAMPFFIFIPLMLRLKKIMPQAVTFTEFIGERFGSWAKDIYFVFGILVVAYVLIEQAVGVAIAFNNIFGVSFRVTAFALVMIVAAYVARAGIRGVIYNDVLQFFLISVFFSAIMFMVVKSIGIDYIYQGLKDVAANPGNVNYNPDALFINSAAGIRYGVTAVVVAMGQILLDQGYYAKAAAAKNDRTLLWSFLIGGIFAWIPISIISATAFGHASLALGIDSRHGIQVSTDISTYVLEYVFSSGIYVIFALMIFMIGITTGGNCLLGVLVLFTVDFYRSKLKRDATEQEQIKFGRTITVFVGLLCALIAIALEGISLLKIDIFSGIFFAAPCGALLAGLYWKKVSGRVAILSVFAGILAGFGIWVYMDDPEIGWYYGSILSLVVPILFILIMSLFAKENFNFKKLSYYDPKHKGRL